MADDRWTWNFDVYDESDAPTKEGYYRTIDDKGNEITDYYFNKPRMTLHGIGYWKYGTRPIIAWKYLGEEVADATQADLLVKTPHKSRESHEKNCETCRDKDTYDEWQGNCDECENGSMYTPQTEREGE